LVQLSDGRAPCAGDEDRCLPGDGQIPLAEIVHAFGEAGYAGYYEMSIWSERLWRRDYRELLCECRERFYDLFCGPRVPLPSLE
jgi:sugar phosphate isomerase/epimerase